MIELKDEEFQWIRTEGALASGMKVYFGASQDEQLPFVLTITPTYAAQKLQKAEERLLPSLPSAWSATGKRIALPTEATLGLKPCCSACFQNVVKSGGRTTPVMISHWRS
jgi:hypothetical protein